MASRRSRYSVWKPPGGLEASYYTVDKQAGDVRRGGWCQGGRVVPREVPCIWPYMTLYMALPSFAALDMASWTLYLVSGGHMALYGPVSGRPNHPIVIKDRVGRPRGRSTGLEASDPSTRACYSVGRVLEDPIYPGGLYIQGTWRPPGVYRVLEASRCI